MKWFVGKVVFIVQSVHILLIVLSEDGDVQSKAFCSNPFGHLLELLSGFIEDGSGFLGLQEVEVAFRNAPNNSLRPVLF